MVVIQPSLRNRWQYQIPPVDGKGFPTRGVSTGLVRCAAGWPATLCSHDGRCRLGRQL